MHSYVLGTASSSIIGVEYCDDMGVCGCVPNELVVIDGCFPLVNLPLLFIMQTIASLYPLS